MADRILPFEPREQNILRFPTTTTERKNLELHRKLDALVDAGHVDMVAAHFEAWTSYLGKHLPEVRPEPKQEPDEEEERPIELTPEEMSIKANPAAYLPKVSGYIDRALYQKFLNILRHLDPKHADVNSCQSGRIGNLRLKHSPCTIEVFDMQSRIGKFYVCSDQLKEETHWKPEYWMFVNCRDSSYRLVNRIVAGRIDPKFIAEAIAEIEAELPYVPKVGKQFIRPEMRGEDRVAVTRFNEWLSKEKENARRSCL